MTNRTARRPSENTEAENFDVDNEEFKDAPSRRKVNQRNENTPKTPKTNSKETDMNTDTSVMLKKAIKLLDGTKGVITRVTGDKVSVKTEDGEMIKLTVAEIKEMGKGYKQVKATAAKEPKEPKQNPLDAAIDAAIGKKVKLLDGETGVIIKTLKTKFKIELDDGDSRLIPHSLIEAGKRFYKEIEEKTEEKGEEAGESYIGKMVKLLSGETGEIVRELQKGKLSVKTDAGRVRIDSANLKQLANGNYKEMKAPVEKKETVIESEEGPGSTAYLMELVKTVKELARKVAKLEKALAE